MDLKKFQLMSEDETHYTVGHPKGKSLRVEKSKLNKKAHDLIQKLKSNVNKYADGGIIQNEEPDLAEINAAVQFDPYKMPTPEPIEDKFQATTQQLMNDPFLPLPQDVAEERAIALLKKEKAQGEETALMRQQAAMSDEQKAVNRQAELDMIAGRPARIAQVPQFGPGQGAYDNDQQQIEIGAQSQGQRMGLTPQVAAPSQLNSAYSGAKSGVMAEAQALKQKGIDEAAAIKAVQDKIDESATPEGIYRGFQQKDKALMDAYEAKKIDPERYYKSLDTGAKISQGIALILGGIGAGLTGGPNVALDMINKKINADIEAQKEDKSAAMNLWKMNKEALGDEMSANLATQNQLYTGLKFKMAQIASKADSQVAMARASQSIAQIDQAIAKNNQILALTQSSDGGSEAQFAQKLTGLKMLSPEMAKDKEEKYIPGVGIASIKPTDKDRELLSKSEEAIKAVTELEALATKGPTFKGSATSAYNQSKVTSTMLKLKDVQGLGVLAGPDMELLDAQVANPGGLYTPAVMAALQATKESLTNTKQTFIDKLGVKPFKQAPQIQYSNGVPYVLNPKTNTMDRVK